MSQIDQPEILLAQPRGFCAGVDRAINIVNEALSRFGKPIYVRHEIVHNKYVVDELRTKGAVFVEELAEVPRGGIVVFSAHGVSQEVRRDAEARGLQVYDATCPLVTKVHLEVVKMCKEGFTVLMIGHAGHPEVEGTMGQVGQGIILIEDLEDVAKLNLPADEKVAFVTQTTLFVMRRKIAKMLSSSWRRKLISLLWWEVRQARTPIA
jgi:4-hydroxy-3-methylbut-2-en-1-yl diphosphate reductase